MNQLPSEHAPQLFPITAVYRRTAEGIQAMMFAADLLRLTRGQRLNVVVPSDPTQGPLAGRTSESLLESQSAQILDDVRKLSGISEVSLTPKVASGIIVDHSDFVVCEQIDTLYPRKETGLTSRGRGPVLIPFGDSLEAVAAAERGLAIARAVALPVVLYHTTWRDDSVASATPQDHMCGEARTVCDRLVERARFHSVDCKTVVETADDVVEGIVRCAMREAASLVVMSRSSKTTVGCYVDQALKQSPVPILTIAALDRRRE